MKNSYKAQRQALLTYLLTFGRINTLQARAMGIMSPAPRVMELRKDGHNIITKRVTLVDTLGIKHPHSGEYVLLNSEVSQ